MHAVLTMAGLHLRYLRSLDHKPSPAEYYHYQKALELFREKLETPIELKDADALIMTATMLGTIGLSFLETVEPANSWLNATGDGQLTWLSTRKGVAVIMEATQQWRAHSLFRDAFETTLNKLATFLDGRPGIADIPQAFVDLCDLNPDSTCDTSPYHGAIRLLLPLTKMKCSVDTILLFFNFEFYLQPQFVDLLAAKDATALLILCYWYALICRYDQWWVRHRATVECTAICIYLENHPDPRIVDLLRFPARACGYALRSRCRMVDD